MKKWKIGILLAVNIGLVYAIFLICIQPKRKYEIFNNRNHEVSRVIALQAKYLPPATIVTVEETKKIRKAKGNRFDLLDSAEKAFLLEAAQGE